MQKFMGIFQGRAYIIGLEFETWDFILVISEWPFALFSQIAND